MAIKTKSIYVASDGKEFTNKDEAEEYEKCTTGLVKFNQFERTPHNVITHAQAKEIVEWQMENPYVSLSGGQNDSTCWHYGKVEIYELLDFIYGYNLKEHQKQPLFKD